MAGPPSKAEILFRETHPLGHGVLYAVRWARGTTYWLWTSVAGKRAPTGIRWPHGHPLLERTAHKRGMEILERRVLEQRHPELIKTEEPPPQPEPAGVSINYAVKQFVGAYFRTYTGIVQKRVNHALELFFIRDEDEELTYDTFYNRISTVLAEKDFAPSYLKRLLQYTSRVGGYCVERDWLKKNPVNAIGKEEPDASDGDETEDSDDAEIWEPAEAAALVEYFLSHPRRGNAHLLLALLLRFLFRTGLRIEEALKLKWKGIREHNKVPSIRVYGKRGPKGRAKVRYFPLVDVKGRQWVPGLLEVLDDLRAITGENEHVFPWRATETPRKLLRNVCRELAEKEIKERGTSRWADGRSLHNFRKSALWWWREELNLDVETHADLAGHSVEVSLKYYRRKRRAAELQRAVTKSSGSSELIVGKL